MRLIITILWILAAVCWTPWLLLVLRLAVDLAMGVGWDASLYVKPALGILAPAPSLGLWPPWRWFSWYVISVWPWGALLGVLLSAAGWRLYWFEQEGRLTRSAGIVALTIIAPLFAPFVMWTDSKHRHVEKEQRLEHEVQDARQRLAD